MVHPSAKAIVIHCMDYRFTTALAAFLKKLGYQHAYDDVGAAGAAKNFADPYDPRDKEFLYRQISISRKLHKIRDVVLVNHADCGAYGGIFTFESADEEYERHCKDLLRAKGMIERRFAGAKLNVIPVFARRKKGGSVEFERVEEKRRGK